ncbi:hypothetical protein ACFQX6_27910 [Streptosporangium lutulentum]
MVLVFGALPRLAVTLAWAGLAVSIAAACSGTCSDCPRRCATCRLSVTCRRFRRWTSQPGRSWHWW